MEEQRIWFNCPHCMSDQSITDWYRLYEINRLGSTITHCKKCSCFVRVYYDGGLIKCTRIGPKVIKGE